MDSPRGAVRLTFTIGGRNPARRTAVGELPLAYALPHDEAVRAWAGGRRRRERRTPRTLTAADALAAALREVRASGDATDEQETVDGVDCLAVPVA